MIEETVILHLLDDTTLNDLFCWVWSLQEMYANIHIALDRDTGYGSQEHKQNLIEILDMAHKNILHLLEKLDMAPKNMLHLILDGDTGYGSQQHIALGRDTSYGSQKHITFNRDIRYGSQEHYLVIFRNLDLVVKAQGR